MKPTLALRFNAAITLIAFTIVGLGSFVLGISVDGKDAPEIQCIHTQEWPSVGGPYYEQTKVEGEYTYFPLGVTCSYDSPDDAVGPQQISHRSWFSTVMVIVSLVMVVISGIRFVKPEAFSRP